MIIVDTGVWVHRYREPNPTLRRLVQQDLALVHPYVIGELALGSLPARKQTLADMDLLAKPPVASTEEALLFLERHDLACTGIGWVDLHLLASTMLLGGAARLWTRDQRLHRQATRLGVSYTPA